ncbi:uncharacterized protein LOC111451244 [Cucurbita moschata]|uniref:Uncharacterized protein LOC111451244 n=1 Tax=Cucurbita moschata TaxID=3662 RepID=A0A6J1G6D2_CUCMO|nr:uncharacterized protein LOC111451244 [Cucurbita moschata]
MEYKRRHQGPIRPSGFEEVARNSRRSTLVSNEDDDLHDLSSDSGNDAVGSSRSSSSPQSLAAKAIKASSAYRDSSVSSAYAARSASRVPKPTSSSASPSPAFHQDSKAYEYTSMKSLNESKHGFWGALARKAKAILDDDNDVQQPAAPGRMREQAPGTGTGTGTATRVKSYDRSRSDESQQKTENSSFQKGLGAITSSLNYIGNAFEEKLTAVENKTADIIQETRKHIKKKSGGSVAQYQTSNSGFNMHSQTQPQPQTQMQTGIELQLKASRDVAMAMAAKAKLLLRELKTVKADLAFAKERCAQLEEESKILRENRERGNNLEDDDLIRLQLETLLAEKARLAHENSVYARENRFLREIVEYHQLTMQDVIYLDEGTEEVTEVYPIKLPAASNLNAVSPLTSQPMSSSNRSGVGLDMSSQMTHIVPTCPLPPSDLRGIS